MKREQAYHRLREGITQGEIKPGKRVVEKVIGERFHLSRTPLREALCLLEMNENLRVIEEDLVSAAKVNDYTAWMAKNALFHGYFLEMTGTPLLSSQVNSLRRRTHRFQVLAVSITGHLQELLADHTKILEAVSERKAEKAGRRMRRHIERTGEILVNFLKENPWS